MSNTKKNILLVALKLFSKNGYDSVSVSQIAEQLGITKGALYKHYKNKRDIFNSIFDYVCELDIERSKKAGIPEKEFSEMPSEFKKHHWKIYKNICFLNSIIGLKMILHVISEEC